MKRCPACQRTYSDDTLTYCLEDGSPLQPGDAYGDSDLPATLIIPDPRQTAPRRADAFVQPQAPPQMYTAPPPPQWTPVAAPQGYNAARSGQGKGLAVASLVCAIAAFLLLGFCIIAGASGVEAMLIGGLFIFSAFLALVGAVLGIVAVAKTTKDSGAQNSRVLAIVALVLNGLYLLISIIFLVLGAIASSESGSRSSSSVASAAKPNDVIFKASRPSSTDSFS